MKKQTKHVSQLADLTSWAASSMNNLKAGEETELFNVSSYTQEEKNKAVEALKMRGYRVSLNNNGNQLSVSMPISRSISQN